MRTINPLPTRLVLKTLKPRNPILVALKAGQCARSGPHQKSRGAVRRAEKMALAKEAAGDADNEEPAFRFATTQGEKENES